MYKIDPYYDSPEWRTLRSSVLKRDKRICQYCGGLAHQADHVIPRRKGGPDKLTNLVACCATCNKTAGGSLFPSFSEKKTYILKNRKKHIPKRAVPPSKHQKVPTVMSVKLTGLRKRLALKNNPTHVKDARLLDKSQS